jgi:hypothetical protein
MASQDGALLPWLYVKARLCQMFGCLPSQLEREDADQILQMARLIHIADTGLPGGDD